MALAKFEPTKPEQGSSLQSSVIRENFNALYQGDFQLLKVRAQDTPDMTVYVSPAVIETFYQRYWVNIDKPCAFEGGNSPTFTKPTSLPRIDIIGLKSDDTLQIVSGTENASPVPPDCPSDTLPLAYIYLKPTMTKIVNYLDKDTNPNEGYIYRDVRPLSKKFTSINFDNVILIDTTTSSTGIIYKTIDDTNIPFIHNFHHPTGQTKKPLGHNLCIGENAGNFTMGSTATQTYHASNNIFIGYQAGKSNTTGYQNCFFGYQAGFDNTIGVGNCFFGYQSGYSNIDGSNNAFFGCLAGGCNTSGADNSFFGYWAGYRNTSGYENSFFGKDSGFYNTTGYKNVFFGNQSGRFNNNGYENSFVGYGAGYYNTNGYGNSFFGSFAGMLLANSSGNSHSTYSVFIGYDTKSKQANQTNEIVIGYNAIGEGSNTVRLGNTDITDVITSGVIKSGGYKSSDGSVGITETIKIKDYSNKTHTLTFKNGILTGHTYV